MLDNETKRRIDTARDILVGKVPDPKSQVEQITIALIYKFMDDMDAEAEELGGKRKFFSGEFDRYGWKKLMAPDLGGFDVLNLYAEAIQKMNINPNIPQLFRDIFKNAYLPYRDPETLKSFLKIIDDFEYDHSERLGDAFEYLLSVLGSQGEAGQFRTPRHIIDLMVDIISPKKDNTILDPACGTAGFLISSYKHILKHNSNNFVPEKDKEAYEQTDVSIAELTTGGTIKYKGDKLTPDERAMLSKNIKGYDISPDMVRLSLVNLYLHGFTDPKIYEYDTLTSEDNWNEYADIILANPPFMSPKGGIKPHKRFSIQSNRSEVLFVDYMVEHLTPNGKAGIIVPEGIIFQSGTAYKQLRKMLVENYLFAVVSLPAGIFQPYSGVKTSILLIDKALNKKTDKILFVKIENDGYDLGAQRRPNNKSQLPTAAALVKDYINICHSALDAESTLTDKFGPNNLWNISTKDKIGENGDWNLSGERYKEKLSGGKIAYPLVALSDICDVRDGTHDSPKYVGDGYPLVTSKNIKDGKIDFENVNYITREDLEKINQRSFVDDGDIIMPMIGTIGNPIVVKKDREFGIKNVALIKFYEDSRIDRYYLRSILDSDYFKNEFNNFSSGSTQKFISLNFIRNLQIPLPPLEIQKEIVAEIEGWQKIIDGARQVVENFNPQIEIDPKWEMVELNEVCEKITDGSHFSPPTVESGFPYITVKDITDDKIDFTNCKFIDKSHYEELVKNDCRPLPNDLLFSKDGTVGKVSLVDFDKEFVVLSSLAIIRPDALKVLPLYLKYILKSDSFVNEATDKKTGVAIRRIVLKTLKTIKIPVPSIETQNQIIIKLSDEEKLIQASRSITSLFEQKIKDKIAKVWGE